VTDAELVVLHLLWVQSPPTVGTITSGLYLEGGASHYATEQKLPNKRKSAVGTLPVPAMAYGV